MSYRECKFAVEIKFVNTYYGWIGVRMRMQKKTVLAIQCAFIQRGRLKLKTKIKCTKFRQRKWKMMNLLLAWHRPWGRLSHDTCAMYHKAMCSGVPNAIVRPSMRSSFPEMHIDIWHSNRHFNCYPSKLRLGSPKWRWRTNVSSFIFGHPRNFFYVLKATHSIYDSYEEKKVTSLSILIQRANGEQRFTTNISNLD